MKKRFIVALDSSTRDQDDKFIEYIKEKRLGWWHWLSNFWLLADISGHLTSEDIRDRLRDIYPGVYTMVIELQRENDTWSGFGPNGDERNMFKWIHETWKP